MIFKEMYRFLRKNLWVTILLLLSVTGIVLGLLGFSEKHNFPDNLYETFRLFFLNISTNELDVSYSLQWAKWLILASFLWATFRLFFEIIAPQFFKRMMIRLFYRNHIIICGLNNITISIIEKFESEKIIVLAEETNEYAETLKTKGKKLLIGDFADENFWQKAKLGKATKLYTMTNNDHTNVKIAMSVFTFLENHKRKNNALKCFVLIKDRELKTILEETALFKYKTNAFDGTIFNINEMGIKYGIVVNIDKIIPKKMEVAPKILLVGLTEKTEIILLNLVYCLTMNREKFNFTIVEKAAETICAFKKNYVYLFEDSNEFAQINFMDEVDSENQYDSMIVCAENQVEAIKQAVSLRYALAKNEPNIFIFCDSSDTLNELLEKEGNNENKKEVYTLKDKNIVFINLFEEIVNYVFDLESEQSRKIEEKAKEAHHFWNVKYKMNKEWDTMQGHFKQSNRNQVLDNYVRAYIAFGEKFENIKNRLDSFSDMETLAMMEHRRWMIEKYSNGWKAGTRNDEFKRHDCLVPWNELDEEQRPKDYDAINLMINLLNNQDK